MTDYSFIKEFLTARFANNGTPRFFDLVTENGSSYSFTSMHFYTQNISLARYQQEYRNHEFFGVIANADDGQVYKMNFAVVAGEYILLNSMRFNPDPDSLEKTLLFERIDGFGEEQTSKELLQQMLRSPNLSDAKFSRHFGSCTTNSRRLAPPVDWAANEMGLESEELGSIRATGIER